MKLRIEKIKNEFFLDAQIGECWKNISVHTTYHNALEAKASHLRRITAYAVDDHNSASLELTEILKEKLNNAMMLLAEVETSLDEWNFPITLQGRVKTACDKFYGGVRPYFDDGDEK